MRKKCPKCGSEFECNHSEACWCTSLEIPEKLSEYLATNYDNCLCKQCLTEYVLLFAEK
ncbi:cysteine-rich CWC family protein [Bacteroidales bacterium OttesenSCG-928-I21]|nr:cysteine-rich CWC family protein [Bacteroidales bacterium OttesenSCG-928-I21]